MVLIIIKEKYIVWLLIFIYLSHCGMSHFVRQFVINAESRMSVCNDGSPAAYYTQLTGSKTWILFLNGGFWCWDTYSCEHRFKTVPWRMTSNMTSETIKPSNVLLNNNPKINPLLYDANSVVIHHCSSDVWSGNVSNMPYHFRGKQILFSVLEDLLDDIVETAPLLFILMGTSAGGVGVLANADIVYTWATTHINSGINFRAIVDSGWFIDLPSFGPCVVIRDCNEQNNTLPGLMTQMKLGFDLWGALPDQSCVSYYLKNPTHASPWNCLMAEVVFPFITTNTFVVQFLTDAWQLSWLGVSIGAKYDSSYTIHDNMPAEEDNYIMYFRGMLFESLYNIFYNYNKNSLTIQTDSNHALHAAVCFRHGMGYADFGIQYHDHVWSAVEQINIWLLRSVPDIHVGSVTSANIIPKTIDSQTLPFILLDGCQKFDCSHCLHEQEITKSSMQFFTWNQGLLAVGSFFYWCTDDFCMSKIYAMRFKWDVFKTRSIESMEKKKYIPNQTVPESSIFESIHY